MSDVQKIFQDNPIRNKGSVVLYGIDNIYKHNSNFDDIGIIAFDDRIISRFDDVNYYKRIRTINSTSIIYPNNISSLMLWYDFNDSCYTDGARSLTTSKNFLADNTSLGAFGSGVSRTVAGWFRTSSAGGTFQTIFGKNNFSTNGSKEWVLNLNSSNILIFAASANGTVWADYSLQHSGFGAVSPDTWYFCYSMFDSSIKKMTVGINDTSNDMAISTDIFGGNATFRLGLRDNGDTQFFGALDSIGVWSRPLSNSELLTLYNNGSGLTYGDLSSSIKTNLDSWWNLDELSGIAYDSQNNNNLNTSDSSPGSTSGISIGICTNNSIISKVIDKSPIGINASQLVTSKRPLFLSDGLNNKGVARFDGVDDFMLTNSSFIDSVDKFTFFVVAYPRSNNSSQYLLSASNGKNLLTFNGQSGVTSSVGGSASGSFSTAISNFSAYAIVYDGNQSTNQTKLNIYYNNTKQILFFSGVIPTSTAVGDSLVLGNLYSMNSTSFNGDVAEIVGYSGVLNDNQISSIMNYLDNKYNLY